MTYNNEIAKIFEHQLPPITNVSISIPDIDNCDDDEIFYSIGSDGEAATFIIEYVDSAGVKSTRRITVVATIGDSLSGSLTAFCHERRAIRTFKVERVSSVIDLDGVIVDDKTRFFVEYIGMPKASDEAYFESEDSRWSAILQCIRPDAYVMCAIARIDGRVDEYETDEIAKWCCRRLRSQRIFLDLDEDNRLLAYLKRCRPLPEQTEDACEWIVKRGPDSVVELLTEAVRIIDADGRRADSEVALVNALAERLIGTPII